MLTALPYGTSDDDFRSVRDSGNLDGDDLTIQDTYDLHALEAQLALLAYSYISEAMEEYRELATTIALAEPTTADKKELYEALFEKTHKQRTWVVTVMAEAYQNAHRESFPRKLK